MLVKASAGGGGKGMRIVSQPDDLADAVGRRTAAKPRGAFGDDTVFLERLSGGPAPRRDPGAGATRRAASFTASSGSARSSDDIRSVIEEAPSPAVTPALRERMGVAAVARGQHHRLLLGRGPWSSCLKAAATMPSFWFLEVNTPAAGGAPGHRGDHRPRPRTRADPHCRRRAAGLRAGRHRHLRPRHRGPAVRRGSCVRLPSADWQPSICGGPQRVSAPSPTAWRKPPARAPDDASDGLPATAGPNSASSWARFDSGIEAGSVVGTEFDPMLAKGDRGRAHPHRSRSRAGVSARPHPARRRGHQP